MSEEIRLTTEISDKYYKSKDKLFIDSFNEIVDSISLKDFYNRIIDILKDEKTEYTTTIDYYKNKQLILKGTDCDEDYSFNCFALYIPKSEKSMHITKNQAEYNENTLIIRLVDRLYHYLQL